MVELCSKHNVVIIPFGGKSPTAQDVWVTCPQTFGMWPCCVCVWPAPVDLSEVVDIASNCSQEHECAPEIMNSCGTNIYKQNVQWVSSRHLISCTRFAQVKVVNVLEFEFFIQIPLTILEFH